MPLLAITRINMGNKSGSINPIFLLVAILFCLFLCFGIPIILGIGNGAFGLLIILFGLLGPNVYILIAIIVVMLVIALICYIGYQLLSKGQSK
jgi:hypothetical protein